MVVVKGLKCLENSQHTAVAKATIGAQNRGGTGGTGVPELLKTTSGGSWGCSIRGLDSRGIKVSIDEVDLGNLAD